MNAPSWLWVLIGILVVLAILVIIGFHPHI